jgi:hypothetical protein
MLKKFAVAAAPLAALALAWGPTAASADTGGPVIVIAPNTNLIAGVEVAGVSTSGVALSCVFTDNNSSVQTCLLPPGQGLPAPVVPASEGGVQVAGVTAAPGGEVVVSCVFDANASGPQTCAIGV